ncbi:hypothetical protein DFJ73DRAFT_769056 [Zopfochytrium polystomum]|nr:hypothetical protein DFJ73DRAFT_769056 [Zopfochytrium polystomum]
MNVPQILEQLVKIPEVWKDLRNDFLDANATEIEVEEFQQQDMSHLACKRLVRNLLKLECKFVGLDPSAWQRVTDSADEHSDSMVCELMEAREEVQILPHQAALGDVTNVQHYMLNQGFVSSINDFESKCVDKQVVKFASDTARPRKAPSSQWRRHPKQADGFEKVNQTPQQRLNEAILSKPTKTKETSTPFSTEIIYLKPLLVKTGKPKVLKEESERWEVRR